MENAAWSPASPEILFDMGPNPSRSLEADFNNGTQSEQRFLATGDAAALELAFACWSRIRSAPCFASEPERFQRIVLNNSGKAYWYRYEAAKHPEDLEQAGLFWGKALTMVAPSSPDRPIYLNNVGNALSARYDRSGDLDCLRQAIEMFREAASTASSPVHIANFSYNLGNAVFRQYLLTHEMRLLEDALASLQMAVNNATTGMPNAPSILNRLGTMFHERYRRSGDPADLESALANYNAALQISTPQTRDLDVYWNDLGLAQRERYSFLGDPALLDQAIQCGRNSVATRTEASEYPFHVANLALSLRERFVRENSRHDLDEAIELQRPVLSSVAARLDALVVVSNGLGACLYDRYKLTSSAADLDEAIDLWAAATRIGPATSQDRGLVLANCSEAWRLRYVARGQADDLTSAINAMEQALPLASGPVPRASRLNGLAISWLALFKRNGNPDLLDKAIGALEEAIELTPPQSPELFLRLNNLANARWERYLRSGDLAYLDEAIALWLRVKDMVPERSPERPRMLHELGKGLHDRYERRHNIADLNAAIVCWQEANRIIAPDSSSRSIILNALGNGLLRRYDVSDDIADLNQAIELLRQGLQLTAPDSPSRSLRLNSLGIALRRRASARHSQADLNEAVSVLREATRLEPEGSPPRPVTYSNLGNALSDLFALTADPADFEAAETAWRTACDAGLKHHPAAALAAARNWGEFAAGRQLWTKAAQAFAYGASAVENLFRAQLLRGNRESWLHEARNLHALGAYAYARDGDVRSAVVMIERGRARLLSDAMERDRARLENLPALGFAELYQRYAGAAHQLSRAEASEVEGNGHEPAPDVAGLRAAREELNAAIASIQRIPGYADLFTAPSFEHISQTLAAPGYRAGVYLLVTSLGAAALTVDSTGARYIRLEIDTSGLLNLLLRDKGAGGYIPAQLAEGSLPAALNELLPAIGESIAGPVAAALRSTPQPVEPVPGLMLVATGLLGLLPLHAATYEIAGQRRCLLDEFAVSYTPSARVLAFAQDSLAHPARNIAGFLGISNPASAGSPALQFAAVEVDEICQFFPGHSKVLPGADATRAALDAAIDTAAYLHFACHGRFRMDKPLHSAVLLAGAEQLTVADLLARGPLAARLAVLSACQSAITDAVQLPDEFIGLPTGFLQAGASCVAGSLWPVDDISTALLMIEFYRWHLRPPSGEPLPPAQALRKAQLWLRDVTAAELSALFAAYKKSAPDAPAAARLPYAMARDQFIEFTLSSSSPGARPFSDAYYWAAFCCYGT
ncbi:MAG: CHAT domain-containing protein [Acidobacteriota bacterium]|nr:CHAT domain-containing protein [Acidobacteriota bacterium]